MAVPNSANPDLNFDNIKNSHFDFPKTSSKYKQNLLYYKIRKSSFSKRRKAWYYHMNHTLFAGAGWADTTPEVGGMLYGYNDDTYSTSCHDHLEIKALALRSGDAAPVLMMSFALADFGTACCTQTREAVAQACDIPFENVLASSTHTHSAPNCAGQAGWGDVDRP